MSENSKIRRQAWLSLPVMPQRSSPQWQCCAFFVVALLLVLWAGGIQAAAVMKDISVYSFLDKTEILLDFDLEVKFQIFLPDQGSSILRLRVSPIDIEKSSLVSAVRGGIVKKTSYRLPAKSPQRVLDIEFSLKQGKYKVNSASTSKNLPLSIKQRIHILIQDSRYQQSLPSAIKQAAKPTAKPVMKPAVSPIFRPHGGRRPTVIAIDPGHGGKDSGAVGPGRVYEKNIVLAVSKLLAEMINNTPNMKAVLARNSDKFLSLRSRLKIIRDSKADIFLSIHADAAASTKARGGSVYILSRSGASSESARLLAERENIQLELGGMALAHEDKTVASILIDLTQKASLRLSKILATTILKGLGKAARKQQYGSAGFVVLKSLDVPSVLIELGYLTNRKDQLLLQQRHYQKLLAERIHQALIQFVARYHTSS